MAGEYMAATGSSSLVTELVTPAPQPIRTSESENIYENVYIEMSTLLTKHGGALK